MNSEIKSMKSSDSSRDKLNEQGRAIARGMEEIQTQKHKDMAKESKRMESMIKNAATKEMFH